MGLMDELKEVGSEAMDHKEQIEEGANKAKEEYQQHEQNQNNGDDDDGKATGCC